VIKGQAYFQIHYSTELKHLKQNHYPVFRLRDLFLEEEDMRVEVGGVTL